jgi:hypothetical protein
MDYGDLSRKNRRRSDVENGMLFEKPPVPLNVPVVFVIQVATGA